jgi:tripartite-type tricarboxylate transporter receptor subunit TctC
MLGNLRPISASARRVLHLAFVSALLTVVVPVAAQQMTKLVVPYAPGGTLDILARSLAPQLSLALGETVVVENVTGANGVNATKTVASAAGDGKTLLLASTSQLAVNFHVSKALNFDPASAFRVAGTVSKVPHVVVVRAKTFADWKEIQAESRASGNITYGTPGVGSTNHLTGALLTQMTGLKLVHVPYRGSGAAIVDLLGGHLDLMIDQIPSALPHISAGRFHAIAVTSSSRLPSLPEVPTLNEVGVRVDPVVAWNLLVVPKGVSADRLIQLRAAVDKATRNPAFERTVVAAGALPWIDRAENAEDFIKTENARWSELIRVNNIQVE